MIAESFRIEHPLARGVEAPAESIWTFPEGLIGLPDFRRFALIELEQAPPFRLLASQDDPAFGLVLVDPVILVPDYVLALEEEELAPLQGASAGSLEILVPVVLPGSDEPLSLNLKGPLVLSTANHFGVQRVSRDEAHTIRFTPGAAGSAPCSS